MPISILEARKRPYAKKKISLLYKVKEKKVWVLWMTDKKQSHSIQRKKKKLKINITFQGISSACAL